MKLNIKLSLAILASAMMAVSCGGSGGRKIPPSRNPTQPSTPTPPYSRTLPKEVNPAEVKVQR